MPQRGLTGAYPYHSIPLAWLAGVILGQRGALFPWSPVALAVGIGVYFGAATEPGAALVASAGAGALAMGGLAMIAGPVRGPPLWALALVLLGVTLAAVRAQTVAAPVLGWRHYGPVQGRVVDIDRSASDAVRLTLDRVYLSDVGPKNTPDRVRISLHGDQVVDPEPGAVILATAHLSPPGGPVEPGGFDFQRHTWFDRLGAIGYTRVPVMVWSPPDPTEVWVFRARMALSERIRAVLPGDTGAFAAAITAGDRSGLSEEVTTTLRRTNLAHLLAISGLHMGLVAGFVFALVRLGGALVSYTALNWPVRSIAALTAIAAGAAYLALSGGAIATERAFVMATVAFVALVLGRRAISMRGLAMAALVVLFLRPEALLSPGFQMSFAATTALVAVFATLRGVGRGWPRWAKGALALVVSSTVAGLATAPVGAAHFNTVSHFGLIANLLSVPVMGLLVMPSAVLAVVVMPLGLEALPLTVMGLGLNWILWVAGVVAELPGAVGHVVAPGPWVLPLLAGGGLIVALWQGRGRWLGVGPLIAALALWSQTQRVDILIEDRGILVGVMTPEGRAISREKSASFTARVWLENDGSGRDQAQAHAIWAAASDAGHIRHLTGKRAAAAASCDGAKVLVLNYDPPAPLPCLTVSPALLRDTGAVAISYPDGPDGAPHMQTARAMAGRRLWNDAEVRENRLWRQ